MSTSERPYHHGDLRAELLSIAGKLLEAEGMSALSLRELARRAGVSHNAPYRHFADREALLAALAADGFARLTAVIKQAGAQQPGLVELGMAYVSFALDQPALFRLMFSGVTAGSIEADSAASLAAAMSEMRRSLGADAPDAAVLSGWAFSHGLAALLLDQQVPDWIRRERDDRTLARDVLDVTAAAIDTD